MPALALTDLANLFGVVKFYKAARAAGVKPIIGCDVWIAERRRSRQALSRCCCSCASRAGYLRLCDLLSRAWLAQPAPRPRGDLQRDWFDEGTEGLIALSGARDGDVGQALLAGNADGRRTRWRAAGRELFPQRFYLELQRAGHADDEALRRAHGARSPRGSRCRWWRRIRCSSSRRDDFEAHEARVCIAEGYMLADQRRPQRFTPRAVLQDAGARWRSCSPTCPQALANTVEIAQRCNLTIELGKNQLPRFPDAGRRDARRVPAQPRRTQGLEQRLAAALSGRGASATSAAPRYRERLEFEIDDDRADGLRRLLPDRRRLHQLGEDATACPVGPGPRLGRRLAGRLRARHHRPRSAALRPAVRALPQSRARVDARLRHRLLPGRPRPRHRLRASSKYGARRASRRSPPSAPWRRRRWCATSAACSTCGYNFGDRIAKLIPFQPGKHITLDDAREMEPLLDEREKNEDEVRELLELGAEARRPDAQRRHARRRRADRAGQAHRLLPAVQQPRARQRRSAQFDKDDVEAVGLVKFDFLGLTTLTILDSRKDFIDARSIPGRPTSRSRRCRSTTPHAYELFADGQDRRGVPVRMRAACATC